MTNLPSVEGRLGGRGRRPSAAIAFVVLGTAVTLVALATPWYATSPGVETYKDVLDLIELDDLLGIPSLAAVSIELGVPLILSGQILLGLATARSPRARAWGRRGLAALATISIGLGVVAGLPLGFFGQDATNGAFWATVALTLLALPWLALALPSSWSTPVRARRGIIAAGAMASALHLVGTTALTDVELVDGAGNIHPVGPPLATAWTLIVALALLTTAWVLRAGRSPAPPEDRRRT